MSKIVELQDVISARDIAEYLKISRKRVYELLDLKPEFGGIPSFRVGASRRVRRERFLEWIDNLERAGYKLHV